MVSSASNFLLKGLAGLASPSGARARLSILIYHRVLPADDGFNTWDVNAGEFEAQMRALAEQFSPLPLSEAVQRLAARSLPARAVCVTFDDGYADNADVALPILRKHRVPATFFIATGYLDGGRMFNDTVTEAIRAMDAPTLDLASIGLGTFALDTVEAKRAAIARILPVLKYLPAHERAAHAARLAEMAGIGSGSDLMMRESQVRELRAAGMEIGAHTVTHPDIAEHRARRRATRDRGKRTPTRRDSPGARASLRLSERQARAWTTGRSMCRWSVTPDSRPRCRPDGVSRPKLPTGFSYPDSRRGTGHLGGSRCG